MLSVNIETANTRTKQTNIFFFKCSHEFLRKIKKEKKPRTTQFLFNDMRILFNMKKVEFFKVRFSEYIFFIYFAYELNSHYEAKVAASYLELESQCSCGETDMIYTIRRRSRWMVGSPCEAVQKSLFNFIVNENLYQLFVG